MFSSSFHLDLIVYSLVQVLGYFYGLIDVWVEREQVRASGAKTMKFGVIRVEETAIRCL